MIIDIYKKKRLLHNPVFDLWPPLYPAPFFIYSIKQNQYLHCQTDHIYSVSSAGGRLSIQFVTVVLHTFVCFFFPFRLDFSFFLKPQIFIYCFRIYMINWSMKCSFMAWISVIIKDLNIQLQLKTSSNLKCVKHFQTLILSIS